MTQAPEVYVPAFCDQVKESCNKRITLVEESVKKVDNRLWGILVTAIVNLIATIGGLIGILSSHVLSGPTGGVLP